MKYLLPYIFIITFLTSSCKTNYVLVKLKNDSREDFKQLSVTLNGTKYSVQDLKSGSSTKFIKEFKTYSICPATAITEKDTIGAWIIDYVGEELYTKGKVIMKFSIVNGQYGRTLDIKSKRRLLCISIF